MEEEEKWFSDIYVTFSLLVLNIIILFYTYFKGTKQNNDYLFEFRRERRVSNEKGKRAKFCSTGVQIVLLYLKTHLLMWSQRLNVVTGPVAVSWVRRAI